MLEGTLVLSIDLAEEAEHVEACLREVEVNKGEIIKHETAFMMDLQLLADLSYVVRVVHHVLKGKVQHLLSLPFAFCNASLCEVEEEGFTLHLILREELQNPKNRLLSTKESTICC